MSVITKGTTIIGLRFDKMLTYCGLTLKDQQVDNEISKVSKNMRIK